MADMANKQVSTGDAYNLFSMGKDGWQVLLWLAPTLPAMLTGYLSYVADLPWHLIIPLCAVTLGGVATMLVAMDRRISERSIRGGLVITGAPVSGSLSQQRLTPGIQVRNNTARVIYVRLEELIFYIEGLTNPDVTNREVASVLPPSSEMNMIAPTISGLPRDVSCQHKFRVRISFGTKKGKYKHQLSASGHGEFCEVRTINGPMLMSPLLIFDEMNYD
jgi:hypothetical protein